MQCVRAAFTAGSDTMALLKYFSRSLPTAKDSGIGELATKEANEAVREELRRQQSEADRPKLPRKRKAYTVFSSEQ